MSFTQNRQQGNKSWLSALWTAGADKRIKEIQRIRDDGTSADEILGITRDLALPITLLFSSVFCFMFYFQYFSEAYPLWIAVGGATIIAVLIELGKVFFGIRVFRYMYFQKPLKSIADTILFFGILLIAALTFYWSFKNSTSGLHDLTQMTSLKNTYSGLSFSPDVASIDQQIAEARKSQEKAASMRWKGRITVEGQRLSRRAEDNISTLQEQRLLMVQQAQKQYDQGAQMAEFNSETAASWTQLVGGLIEGLQLLMIIIAASCERKLSDRLASGENPNHPESPDRQTANTHPHSNNGNASFSGNGYARHFNSVRDANTLSERKPIMSDSMDGDFIRLRIKQLKGWDDNFNHKNNRPETVATNMCRIFNEIGQKMLSSSFHPDKEAVSELIQYATLTGWPAMEKAGYIYQDKDELLAICQRYTAAAVAA